MRIAKATVRLAGDERPYVVCETPSEVASAVEAAHDRDDVLIELSLANPDDWNGKPLYINPFSLHSVSPPISMSTNDDDD